MAAPQPDPVSGLFRAPPDLDVDSHTARRLQHASHKHLHITSRRCFIGPIPEAWLSRHRKSWYKYRPHLSTYSSRTATFNASTGISYSKQLTGMSNESRASTNLQYSGPSFPQPDDVSDDEPAPADGASSQSSPAEPRNAATLTVSKGAVSKQVGFQLPSAGQSMNDQIPEQRSQRPSLAAATSRRRSSFSEANKTFVTAPETIRTDDTNSASSPPAEPLPARLESTSTRNSAASASLLQPSTASKNRASVNSMSPLLLLQSNSDGAPGGGPAEPGTSDPDTATATELARAAQNGQTMPAATHGPTVHFDITKTPRANELSSAAHVKDTLLRSILRSSTEPGELIKAERMLVRVDWTKHELASDFTENDSLRIESKVVDTWREFMVVCRKSSTDDGGEDEFVLRMNKTRVIPVIDQKRTSSHYAHSIPLHRKVTRVNMYSSLDKSIVLWHPWKKGTRVYVLRPRSAANAVEWFTFLNALLGWKRPQSLNIHVPDLNVSLSLDRPFEALKTIQDELLSTENSTNAHSIQEAAKDVVSNDIISRCATMLANSPLSQAFETWLSHDAKIGLAWKRYDRLEWVHGANEEKMYGSMAMQTTHDLELRSKQHYPTCVGGSKHRQRRFEEPAPVEGFLVRLTSQTGRHTRLGKSFFKRLYFSSHDQYLCFSLPASSMPPKPPKLTESHNLKSVPKAAKLAEKIPLIYAVNPYPLQDERISWLAEGNAKTKDFKDEIALNESQRNIQTLMQSRGFIDLCQVKEIRKQQDSDALQTEEDDEASDDEQGGGGWFGQSEELRQSPEGSDADHVFELVLSNGLVVKLQAYDSVARDEWIKRLRDLSRYWKLRTAADMKAYKAVRQQNLNLLDINEEMESTVGQFAQKWEVMRAVASAELFNMCGISCCRSITMSGTIFVKPRLHAKFRRCTAILSDGKLLLFQSALRTHSGRQIPHIHHERLQTIDLKDTYVYSGLVTENDLLYRNQTFDSNHPGHHALPRVYLEDNWTSSDEDTMTCFVIWHGTSRSLFRAAAQQEDGSTRRRLRYVSSLGRPGRAIVFKPRSRAERDRWVTSIAAEVERLQLNEDMRVVGQ